MAEQLRKRNFRPVGFGVSLPTTDGLRAMKLKLLEEEVLHSKERVDQMDLCEDEEHIYMKIIGYKSGNIRFDLAVLYCEL